MPVVQNTSPGPVIHTDSETDVVIEWGPKQDVNGTDIQDVPETMLKKPHLARAIRSGVLRIVDESEAEALQEAAFEREAAHRQATALNLDEIMDTPDADRDIMEMQCVVSGKPVFMSQGDARNRPPLAEGFEHLADQFVATPTGEIDAQGQEVVAWTRMVMEAPEKETV